MTTIQQIATDTVGKMRDLDMLTSELDVPTACMLINMVADAIDAALALQKAEMLT